jgi:hypothetical protein
LYGKTKTSKNQEEVLTPSIKVPPTPPPKPTKRQSLTSAPNPVVAEQPKRVRVPSITIKWELIRVRSEIVLSNMKNNSFLHRKKNILAVPAKWKIAHI